MGANLEERKPLLGVSRILGQCKRRFEDPEGSILGRIVEGGRRGWSFSGRISGASSPAAKMGIGDLWGFCRNRWNERLRSAEREGEK